MGDPKKGKFFQNTPFNFLIFSIGIITFVSVIRGDLYCDEQISITNPRLQIYKNFPILPILYFITLNNVRDKKTISF